jgi:predicted O-methyltransferase YrrM
MSFKKRVIFGLHRSLTRLKFHLLPVHYYSPVVNLLHLETHKEDWARRSEMPGIEWNGPAQLRVMREICLPYQAEYKDNRHFIDATSNHFGPGYGPIEAQALHAFVRHYKPGRIIEVGSGVSTACMLAATKMNADETGRQTSITCVEPYPSRRLKDLKSQGQVELINRFVQAVNTEVFQALGDGDLLFIDSSHTVKTGSDVNYLFLEILPRLKPGVLVHVHDVYFPYDYSPLTLRTLWHWSETSLLRAHMTHNPKIRTLFCMSLMHHDYADAMKEIFPTYAPEPVKDGLFVEDVEPMGYPKRHFPASIYLRAT